MSTTVEYPKEKAVETLKNTLKTCNVQYDDDGMFLCFGTLKSGDYAFRLWIAEIADTPLKIGYVNTKVMVTLVKYDISIVLDNGDAFLIL